MIDGTVVIVSLFAFCSIAYLGVLFKKVVLGTIDIYELVMLSAVVVVPAFFLAFPSTALRLTNYFEIKFPFILLFQVCFF